MLEERYAALPDGMSASDAEASFLELLAEIESRDDWELLDVIAALHELADRQWHTYTLLSPSIRQRVETWILAHWRPDVLEFVEQIGFVTGCLGLTRVHDAICAEDGNPLLDTPNRERIRWLVEQGNVDNPYSGMPGG